MECPHQYGPTIDEIIGPALGDVAGTYPGRDKDTMQGDLMRHRRNVTLNILDGRAGLHLARLPVGGPAYLLLDGTASRPPKPEDALDSFAD